MSHFAAFCRLTAVICALAAPVSAQQSVTLSVDQMRGFAADLLAAGDAPRALAVTESLLARNPGDVGALILRAQAALILGEQDLAIQAAAAAYRTTDKDDSKYVAARLAARAHAEQEQDTRGQIWLRRARQFAPNDAAAADVADDYRFLRRRNPWSTQLRFGITPSGNVNNGTSNSTTQGYDFSDFSKLVYEYYGVYDPETDEVLVGTNQQALSGVSISAGIDARYRLRQSATDITFLNFGLDARTAILSNEAKEASPSSSGSDFSNAVLTLGLTHRWITDANSAPWSVNAEAEKIWSGGDPYSTVLRAGASHSVELSDDDRLRYGAEIERVFYEADRPYATKVTGNLGLSRLIDDDRALNFGFRGSLSTSDYQDADYRSLVAFGSYDLGRPVPNVATTLSGYYEDRLYDETFYGPAERSEKTASASLSLIFEDIEFYGFLPVMTLRASKTASNLRLFEREALGLSFDLRSSF